MYLNTHCETISFCHHLKYLHLFTHTLLHVIQLYTIYKVIVQLTHSISKPIYSSQPEFFKGIRGCVVPYQLSKRPTIWNETNKKDTKKAQNHSQRPGSLCLHCSLPYRRILSSIIKTFSRLPHCYIPHACPSMEYENAGRQVF